MGWLLCWLGIHKWEWITTSSFMAFIEVKHRECCRCHRHEVQPYHYT